MPVPVPVVLTILDGWGIAEPSPTNAVSVAATPNMDRLSGSYPMTTLTAHNGLVGLPEGQMGNSEVGHLNIGAGRIVYQDFTRIDLAAERGEFAANPVLAGVMDAVSGTGGRLHLCGLLSDGGVHSHIRHLIALLEVAAAQGLGERVFVHAFMDGRDTPPSSGISYMEELVGAMARTGCGRVATVSGRYWAMDRDKRWDRVAKAWAALVHGEGATASDPVELVRAAYERGETDEFIAPTVLVDGNGRPLATIADGDAILFFNFRADRVRELCHAFGDAEFTGFATGPRPHLAQLATMTEYEAEFTFPVAFPPVSLTRILGEEVSRHGRRQLRIAETEKYAHVTYFFNGGVETPYPGEDRVLVPSPKVATYDLQPEMSAREVTDKLVEAIQSRRYDAIVCNYANGDMVGHTGNLEAATRAVEVLDECIGRIVEAMRGIGGEVLITADHGNAETMRDPESHQPHTAHTLNLVPLLYIGRKARIADGGSLQDVAPTLLAMMGLPQPADMTGRPLIEFA